MGMILYNGQDMDVAQFAEMLVISAMGDSSLDGLDQYQSVIAGLDEETACQLRVAMQGISMVTFLDPELETGITNYLEDIHNGVSTSSCPVPNMTDQHFDLKVDDFKP